MIDIFSIYLEKYSLISCSVMSSGRPPTQRCRELVEEELPADDVLPPAQVVAISQ